MITFIFSIDRFLAKCRGGNWGGKTFDKCYNCYSPCHPIKPPMIIEVASVSFAPKKAPLHRWPRSKWARVSGLGRRGRGSWKENEMCLLGEFLLILSFPLSKPGKIACDTSLWSLLHSGEKWANPNVVRGVKWQKAGKLCDICHALILEI